MRQPVVYITGDDIPDVLVGLLSQIGFKECVAVAKIIQIFTSGMQWWPHRLN